MKRSKHNLSHHVLTTTDLGFLTPIGCVEVLPGDSIQHVTGCLTRAQPLATPPIHPVSQDIHHWFVPYRLLWENWETFITGGADGLGIAAADFPTINLNGRGASNMRALNGLGVPAGTYATDTYVSALPIRAYQLIYNEFYRDEDLIAEPAISLANGVDTTTSVSLRFRAWEKDYFSTCRPWEQKGPDVTVSLGSTAPVYGDGKALGLYDGTNRYGLSSRAGTAELDTSSGAYGDAQGTAETPTNIVASMAMGVVPDGDSGLFADLASAVGIDVNDLRLALAVQRYQEARARYGSRYTEYLAYLGVRSSDARLQRPEYLGGGSSPLQFSEVLSTSSGSAGELYGHGISTGRTRAYRRFFEEHGVVISIYSAMPRTVYANAIQRMFLRRTKEDFWQRELQHIGQQIVTLGEVNFRNRGNDDGLFGYQDRYDEYRFTPSRLAGSFNEGVTGSLLYPDWHFARQDNPTGVIDPANGFNVNAVVPPDPFQADLNDANLIVAAYHRMIARRLVSPRGTSFIF